MKKIITLILSVLVVLGLSVTAIAVSVCTVSADSVTASPGENITVPVRIAGNSGFTNFSIMIDYDREALELVSIDTQVGRNTYLCGDYASVNTDYKDENGKSFGYINCALSDKCGTSGVLFTVTFKVSEDFEGEAEIRPVVNYIRNNAAVFSVFEEVTADVNYGTVTVSASSPDELKGDVNGDGTVDVFDIAALYSKILSGEAFDAEDMAASDVNGDGNVDVYDTSELYRMILRG